MMVCEPCEQDPMDELTEASCVTEAERRELGFARKYCDQGVPRYTFLRQNFHVTRKRVISLASRRILASVMETPCWNLVASSPTTASLYNSSNPLNTAT